MRSLGKFSFLEKIIALSPGNIYWKDTEGRYLGCNMNQLKLIGLTDVKEVLGKTDYDFYDKEIADRVRQIDKHVMNSKTEQEIEEVGVDKYGKKAIYLSRKVPLPDEEGNIIGLIGTSIEITKEKQLEKNLTEAIRSKTTFLSIASHEIKGPLSNNIYVLEKIEKTILEDTSKTPALLPLIRDQLKDTHRGVDTINYLLDFLNLDLTTDSLKELREVPLASRIIDILDPYEEQYTSIEFSLNYDKQLPKILFVPKGLEEIIKILVANAVKYTKKNAFINVKVSNLIKDEKNYLNISVEDNGVGIHQAALDRFFAPLLFEGMKDGERIYSAPAIKLSYIKKFIESLGGEFTIQSQPDVGTTVTITVPYEKSDSDYNKYIPSTWDQSETIEKEISHRRLNFLIVEDNPMTLQILEDEISKLGHHVDAVSNAHEALKKAKEHDYEVAFLDISLPGIDGVELQQKLTRKSGNFPIVIAITSHDSDVDKNYFYDKGFVAVISKPFTKDDILACVDSIQRVLIDLESDD